MSDWIDPDSSMLRDIARQLRACPGQAPRILDNIDIGGVDWLAESAVVLRGRIRGWRLVG